MPADSIGRPTTPAKRALGRAALAAIATLGLLAVAGASALLLLRPAPPAAVDVAQRSAPLLAVLPFANQSGDRAQDYFSDGITEDVIAALGRFSTLAVLSRNAMMPFKGSNMSPADAAQKTGARYVVEGSVRRADDRVRIQARLTDAQGGRVLWSDRFDGSARELFKVQDELVQQIAGTLATQVGRVESDRAGRKPTDNLDAYDLVLRGRALLEGSTRAAHVQARGLFERAIAMDPKYADARVWLAHVLYFYVQYGFTETPLETAQQAEALLREAIAIDPGNSLAHGGLGKVLTFHERYDEALASIERALALNANDAESHYARAVVLFWSSRLDEAAAAYELAQRLDPATAHGPERLFVVATSHLLMGQPDKVRATLESRLQTLPRYAPLYAILAIAYAELGRSQDAEQAAALAKRLDPFLDPENFGTRLRDPAHRRQLADSMRKVGFGRN